ncbi:hypothetical protein DL98DRAFT_594877 [Cadophora sp. DSE1049]|nr:hypothetical protein DL98DRAFT_594877 [Cadophora sp. DSE1049]
MAQNIQQYGYGQTAPPTSSTPAVTIESASFQNVNNIDPALRGDDASSSQGPSDPKKRSRDDEEGEVLGRPKVPRKVEPTGKDKGKAPIENPRKRRGSLLGPEMCSTPNDQSMMSCGQGTQSTDLNQTGTSAYPSQADTPASANPVAFQASDPSARPICKLKSKLNSIKTMASGLPQALPVQWQDNSRQNGSQYPSVEHHNGGEGSSQDTPAYDQGYGYPQPNWNGGQSSYDDEFSDRYSMPQQGYGTAYSDEPSEIFDVLGQRQAPDDSSATYSWGELCSYVLDKEVEITAIKNGEIFYLQQTAASNLNDQRRIDKEEYLEILGQKDDALNEIQSNFLELEASIPGKLLEREQATRSVCESQYETKQQEWLNVVSSKDARIQELESQLNRISNAPPPQAKVVVQVDPRVATLQEQIVTYEAADRERSKQDGDSESKAQKVADDLKEALELVKTLRSAKAELENSEKELQNSAGKLTAENEELTQQLQRSESAVDSLKVEKDAAEGKVSTLETQIQDTPKFHPDVEKELSELVGKVQELEESAKEVTTLTEQLRESQEQVKTLEVEADKVPALIKELEERKEKVSSVETAAGKHARHFPRSRVLPVVYATPVSHEPITTKVNPEVSSAKAEAPSKPAWLVAVEKDQPRRLICTIKLTEENTDLKDANAKLSKELRITKKQKKRAEASLDTVTENFQTQGEELSRLQKIKDMPARALMLVAIFWLFSMLCIPHLLSNPTNQTTSPTIRNSPLRTEVLSKIHRIPNLETVDNVQFEDLYPDYRFGPQDEDQSITERIRVTEIYHEYLEIMNDKAAQRSFPNPTTSYPQQPSPAQEGAIYEEQPIHEEKPTTPPSPIEPPTQKVKSGFRLFLDDTLEVFLGILVVCGLFIVACLVAEFWNSIQRWMAREREIQEHNAAHHRAHLRRVQLESRY